MTNPNDHDDMPETIYLLSGQEGKAVVYGTVSNSARDNIKYTRSDLCVPRSEYDKLKQQVDKLAEALRYLLEMSDDIPDSNCSCHIRPPCNDCVNYSGIREATQEAQQALNEYNAEKGN